ncbi:MAG: CoA transferase, partial [Novosphingobium sp.]
MTAGPAIPLVAWADRQLQALADLSGAAAFSWLSGATVLGERAALNGFRIPGRVSAGGGCRLYDAIGGTIALALPRADDRALLPALFADASLDPADAAAIARAIAGCEAGAVVQRGSVLGLAIAAVDEAPVSPACVVTAESPPKAPSSVAPLVVDLSALWAGPLAAHLLGLAGARVVKVESRNRPDAMRSGDPALFGRLNRGKASAVVDLREIEDRAALLALLGRADVVIEAARPRALLQLGIDADAIVAATPGLVWITITGHGSVGDAANRIGFGDDCAVAGGLSAALRRAAGRAGFVGDAIADPFAGLYAARTALARGRRGGRLILA